MQLFIGPLVPQTNVTYYKGLRNDTQPNAQTKRPPVLCITLRETIKCKHNWGNDISPRNVSSANREMTQKKAIITQYIYCAVGNMLHTGRSRVPYPMR
jgi:hypothetical protein